MANTEQIKELRELTGAGFSDIKEALEISKGDTEAAKEYLVKKGLSKAEKRAGREAKEGLIGSYVHNTGKIAVLVEVNCETDFVARSDVFIEFTKDIAMQIIAANALYVSREDLPETLKNEFINEVNNDPKFAGKPEAIKQTIVDSKINTYAEEFCLMEQSFFKDGSQNISDMLKIVSSKVGEAIKIKRFVKYQVGE